MTCRTAQILVVDDEPIIADTITLILKQSGYAAQSTYNGEQALRIAEEFLPDVLITDVVMPGMSGTKLAAKIARILPDCRILLHSGNASASPHLQYDFPVLAKPSHPRLILKWVEDVLASYDGTAGSRSASFPLTVSFPPIRKSENGEDSLTLRRPPVSSSHVLQFPVHRHSNVV